MINWHNVNIYRMRANIEMKIGCNTKVIMPDTIIWHDLGSHWNRILTRDVFGDKEFWCGEKNIYNSLYEFKK